LLPPIAAEDDAASRRGDAVPLESPPLLLLLFVRPRALETLRIVLVPLVGARYADAAELKLAVSTSRLVLKNDAIFSFT
jgi:hypothetical protein